MTDLDFLNSPDVRQFIWDNEKSDIHKLLLNPPAEFEDKINLLVDQIVSRNKAKHKIPDWYHNSHVIFPPQLSLEQCSSPPTADYKAQLMSGRVFTDLTGGMGIDTLALSRSFESAHYVEMSAHLCAVFQYNAKMLGHNSIQVHHTSAEEYLQNFQGKGHFFIDPARRGANKSRVYRFEDCTPNLLDLLPTFQSKADKLLVKAAPMIDINLGLTQLKHVQEVHVLSVRNEVKEILFLLDFQSECTDPPIHCVNLETAHSTLSFTKTGEQEVSISFGEIGQYLYDPNAAILKAGAFKLTGAIFGLDKIAPNTHLYTSNELVTDFPGRIFEVIETNVSKKNIAQLLHDGRANVFTKNYPLKPEEIRKKLKVKDGGDYFLIGYRDMKNKPTILAARSVSPDPN